jgi:hypothetical protein
MRTKLLLLFVLVLPIGCQPIEADLIDVDGDGATSVLEHLVAVGTWMEVARYHSGTFTCESCVEVIRWDFAFDDDNVAVDFTIFQHDGADPAAAACHMRVSFAPQDVDGVAPRARSVTLGHTESDECFNNPADFMQLWQVAAVDDDNRPTIVANWQAGDARGGFPGWFADDGSGAFPIAPCPEDERIAGGAYCDPGCDVGGGSDRCSYPSVSGLGL